MNIAIVGAGIMGCLLALRLHREGWNITLFEAEQLTKASSYAAAGLLAPLSELDKAEHIIFTLGGESIGLWKSIMEQLPGSIYFKQRGSLVVHHPQDAGEWSRFSARIANQLSNTCYEVLYTQDIEALEPELRQFGQAYYFPKEAQLDSQAVFLALRTYLQALNLAWSQEWVAAVAPGAVFTASAAQSFDVVFDCRGLGAKAVLPTLRGIRGELLWLHAPEVRITRPVRLLHPRYTLYIAPRPGCVYLVGASELESEDLSDISVRTALELLTAAYYVHRGFAEARIIRTVTQCRAAFPHHQPRIHYSPRFVSVNGLYRHGYLLAPSLAEEIVRGVKSNYQGIHYPEIWEAYSW